MSHAKALYRLPAVNKPTLALMSGWTKKIWFKAALAILAAAFSLLYVVQINMTATKGYEIRELERSLSTLQHEARVLRLQSLELQSMDRLQSQLKEETNLVRIVRPDGFVSPASTSVAAAVR